MTETVTGNRNVQIELTTHVFGAVMRVLMMHNIVVIGSVLLEPPCVVPLSTAASQPIAKSSQQFGPFAASGTQPR